jgi:hypothetical protein
MNGFARIQVFPNKILVRFEQVDCRRSKIAFNQLLDRFYHNVPSAKWNQSIRWMVVPRYSYAALFDFCFEEFGPENVRITHKGSKKKATIQLPLNL